MICSYHLIFVLLTLHLLAYFTGASVRSGTTAAMQSQLAVAAIEVPVFAHETAQYSALLGTLLHDAIKVCCLTDVNFGKK